MASVNQKAINLWTARVIPVVLIGLAGYATWVVVVLVCIDYLLKPSPTIREPRSGAGIAILTIYACLLSLLAVTYFRLTYTVVANPGYTPRGPQWHAGNSSKRRRRRSSRAVAPPPDLEKQNGSAGEQPAFNGVLSASPGVPASSAYGPAGDVFAPGLRDFYKRDVFTCESDGRPIWCSTCLNWKLDRAHHCREVGRCVRKMDHFCPWVGGIVSETSQKFFVLFVCWGSIYCAFILVFMAKFVAERAHTGVNVHWIVVLSMAGLFSLFLLGMSGSSLQFVLQNTTTIENLSRKTKVWQLAVLIPGVPAHSYSQPPYRTITYGQDPNNTRTFAILHTRPGENPWDLGYSRNFKSVMGEHWYDWILPIKPSPCANHDRQGCQFELGPAVERMKSEVGIISHSAFDEEKPRRHRRRRRRRSTHTRSVDPAVEGHEPHKEERRKKKVRPLRDESRRDSGVDR
ncbi:Palmitoyltransferase pfa5 [Xanthoria calcicola]